jgi:hypothetical protein
VLLGESLAGNALTIAVIAKCFCRSCSGHIEFEADDLCEENSTIQCPHCSLPTKLWVLNAALESKAAPEERIPVISIPAAIDRLPKAKTVKQSGRRLPYLTEESIRARTKTADTPLHRAAKQGRIHEVPSHLLTAELFMAANDSGETPLHVAAMYGHLNQVPLEFLTKTTLAVLDKYGRAALHAAAGSGYINTVPIMLVTGHINRLLIPARWRRHGPSSQGSVQFRGLDTLD